MAIAVVMTLGFLVMLGLVLFNVGRRRPATFRLTAKVTKWVTLDLEMGSPEDGHKRAPGRRSISNENRIPAVSGRRAGNLCGISDLL